MPRVLSMLLLSLCLLLPPGAVSAAGPEYEQRVVDLVNRARVEAGLGTLTLSPELTTSARRYADYMGRANFFGHEGPDGSTLVTRNEAAGYTGWSFLAENLAAGQLDPETAVRAWLDSPSHRANILSPRVREIGVGYAYHPGSEYGHYWVQEFGTRMTAPIAASAASPVASLRPTGGTQPVLGASSGPAEPLPPAELRDAHASLDTLGNARSGVVRDEATGQWVQYYQRAVLEWHPENEPGQQVQRRLLADIVYPGAEPPVPAADAPPGPSEYYPPSVDQPRGLGHFVADFTRDGQPLYFKQFFDAHGGVATFGYPKEEPRLREGRWTQRFQAAVLQYHPEFDRDGYLPGTSIPYRAYRVQLELLGEKYMQMRGIAPSR